MFKNEFKNRLKDSFFDDINGCSLDNSQRKVVLDESDNLLVIAGAGSGKTLTIVGKIKYLVSKKNINIRDILCISFTNETVNNLKGKIGYDIDCYTFHKLALRILNENSYDYIIVDEFAKEHRYYDYIKDSPNIQKGITFMTKAEDQCLSVACSSLISRYIFLKEMDKLSKELNITLPKGANPQVDEIGKKIVSIYGKEKLNQIAKLNFKNTEKILNS